MKKLFLLLLVVLVGLPVVYASLNCSYNPHVQSLPTRQIRWSCNLNTTRDVSCVSYMKDPSGLVQINPTGELSTGVSALDLLDRDAQVEYFTARNGLLNVYFEYSGLQADINYSLGVLCSNGDVFERNVTVDFREPREVADRAIWTKGIIPYILFIVLFILMVVFLYKIGKRLYG